MPPARGLGPADMEDEDDERPEPASLFGVFVLGAVFVAAGLMLVMMADDHGAAVTIGWVVAAIGGAIVQVGVVAAGVELGVRRAHQL